MESFTRYVLPALAGVLALVAIALGVQGMAGYGLFAWVGAGAAACGAVIARSTRLGVLLTAIGCLASNLYLLSRKWAADAGPSVCTVSETINCDVVNNSQYSEMFGIPVTLIGAAFYAGLSFAALASPKSTPRFHQVNALFALVALVYSAYLAFASVSIGALCVLCISIYLGNLLLLVAGVKGLRETGQQIFEDLGSVFTSRSFGSIVAVFLVAVLVGRAAWMGRGTSTGAAPDVGSAGAASAEAVANLYAEPRGEVTLDGTEPVLGDRDAPYLVVEYADFACPHCAQAAREFKQVVAENPDIQVRFKAFPLSGVCNPALQGDQGGERCVAAMAAECARAQGRFWELSSAMFANPSYLAPDALAMMADEVGLDVEPWKACLQDSTTARAVAADIEAGIEAGVQGTPTLFLRGTHGSDFVLITYGVGDLLSVVEAHRAGVTLPDPGPPPLR